MAKKNMSQKSLDNLNPIDKGEIRNKFGRKGKDGKGGLSLLNKFRAHMSNIESTSPTDIQMIWNGLIQKCKEGDTRAIELMIKLNGEKIDSAPQDTINNNGPTIIMQMPPMEEKHE